MKHKILLVVLAVVAALTTLFIVLRQASKGPSILNQIIDEIDIKGGSIADLECALRWKGFYINTESLGGGNLTIKKKSVTLKEILDEVCEKTGSYTYEVNEDVINIFPLEALKYGEKYPFNKKVRRLDIEDEDVEKAIEILTETTDFPGGVWMSRNLDKAQKVSLHLENVTVRQALNQIIKIAGLCNWGCHVGKWKHLEQKKVFLILSIG